MSKVRSLSYELSMWKDKIRQAAVGVGLDFFEVTFEMVNADEMNELAAQGGFPSRYPHWRFGMEYDKLSKSYSYGLSKIYEMVINTDPCYAYLLTSNSILDQKLVMAHVYGHSDFFKQNKGFSHTNRKMLDTMANHANRVRRYMEKYGQETVEEFVDRCLSLDNLIDYHSLGLKKKTIDLDVDIENESEKSESISVSVNKSYLEKFLKDYPKQESPVKNDDISSQVVEVKKTPQTPQKDVLLFLIEKAPLKDWQLDILSIIRDEAYYFAPQGQTKIMNEGWASYWHSVLMTSQGIMNDSEIISFADVHSGTMYTPPGGFNPYKIGLELFRDIEERWNKGQFGKQWEECEDVREKTNWDTRTMLGKQKIFEVRKLYSDISFLDTFLTEDFCVKNKLFSYAHNPRTQRDEIDSREFKKVKASLLQMLTNFGQPVIEVVDANYQNRGELLLEHRYDGRDLRPDYSQLTLTNLKALWGRPVHIQTQLEGKNHIISQV